MQILVRLFRAKVWLSSSVAYILYHICKHKNLYFESASVKMKARFSQTYSTYWKMLANLHLGLNETQFSEWRKSYFTVYLNVRYTQGQLAELRVTLRY